jgi:hypothetical protein
MVEGMIDRMTDNLDNQLYTAYASLINDQAIMCKSQSAEYDNSCTESDSIILIQELY